MNRLIAFLKKPDALAYDTRTSVRNAYDDYDVSHDETADFGEEDAMLAGEQYGHDEPTRMHMIGENDRSPSEASRLDALLLRAIQQFNAQMGYILRYEQDGRMRYCTGRDAQGRYIPHTEVAPDRRAVFLALDSGESQLFVSTDSDSGPTAVLCGPLWHGKDVVGVLYLDNPVRGNHLHRGMFDLFCQQVARLLFNSTA